MQHFRDKCQRLQCAWTQTFKQEQFGKVMQIPFVCHCKNSAEPLKIDIRFTNVMVRRQLQVPRDLQNVLRTVMHHIQHCGLSGSGLGIDKIQNRALAFTNDSRVRLRYEIPNAGGMPVISSRQTRLIVKPLLNDSPFSRGSNNKAVEINLKSVLNRIVVNSGRQTASANQVFAVKPASAGNGSQFSRRVPRVSAAA